MKLKTLTAIFALGFFHFAASAAAVSPGITFEDLAVTAPSTQSLTSNGFVFITGTNGLHGIFNAPYESAGPTGTSQFLAANVGQGLTESFNAPGNGIFNLSSLDISGFYNFQGSTKTVTLTGLRADNSTVTFDASVLPNTFTTFSTIGFTNLKSVTFSMSSGSQYVAFDNLIATPVPEPETYALMLGGLALVGWAARRRKLA